MPQATSLPAERGEVESITRALAVEGLMQMGHLRSSLAAQWWRACLSCARPYVQPLGPWNTECEGSAASPVTEAVIWSGILPSPWALVGLASWGGLVPRILLGLDGGTPFLEGPFRSRLRLFFYLHGELRHSVAK